MIPKKEDILPFVNNRKQLANKYEVTEKTVINWFKKYDIYVPKKNYGSRKLDLKKALEIRELHESGVSIKELSKKYKVTFASISRIVSNVTYKVHRNFALINVIYNN